MNNTNSLCGLIMPISAIDGCNEQHWLDVKQILTEAIELSGYSANLVSYADDVGIIQKRIIQNLYENPIVVCDVSGKNPNVMFELGMRLAFDKPTIIVKDDKTSYSFDTSPIEHLEYPRDLRFKKIVDFKDELAKKIKATVEKSNTDPGYTTFLKHFGTFTVAKLDSKEVSKEDYIIEE
ncbi:TPA: RNA helicase, partial [Vibrio cholerae]|nr:RNA helicase [Vibrio cholerae]